MNALTIVTVVRALVATGQTNEQIAGVLSAMGFNIGADQPQAVAALVDASGERPANARQTIGRGGRRGGIPAVKYSLVAGMGVRAVDALQLPPQQQEIADYIRENGPANRAEITEALEHTTKKVTESALYALRVRGVLESIADEPATPERRTVKPAKAGKRGVPVKRR